MASKTAFEQERGTFFKFPPNDLIIIGLDTDDGAEHALWRADVKEPIPPTFVDSIRKHGVLQPIRVRRIEGDSMCGEVVVGRSRVRAARVVAKDGPPVLVPAVVFPSSATLAEIVGAANAENHQRKTENIESACEHAHLQLVQLGGDDSNPRVIKEIAGDFGWAPDRLRALLAYRGAADVRAAFCAGEIGQETALRLAPLPTAQRAPLLKEAMEQGLAQEEVRERIARVRSPAGDEKQLAFSAKTLRKLAALEDTTLPHDVVAFLKVATGKGKPSSVSGLKQAMRAIGLIGGGA